MGLLLYTNLYTNHIMSCHKQQEILISCVWATETDILVTKKTLILQTKISHSKIKIKSLIFERQKSLVQRLKSLRKTLCVCNTDWNKLSTDCVTARSVNMFKNKVDTYLRRAGYK